MVELGVLAKDEPIELLEGELIIVSPQGPTHSNLTVVIHQLLQRAYGESCFVRAHSPVDASPSSLPEPDLAVVQGDVNDFWQRLPNSSDTVLVVEISLTSTRIDLKKAAIYGRAGFKNYWRIDVAGRRLEMREQPSLNGEYERTRLYSERETVSLPGCNANITVAQLLPRG